MASGGRTLPSQWRGVAHGAASSCSTTYKSNHINFNAKEIQMESQYHIKKNSLPHRILACLAQNGTLAASQIKASVGITDPVSKIEDVLHNQLLHAGYVMRQEMTWSLTNAGLDMKIMLGGLDDIVPMRRGKVQARQNDLFARGNYDGAELKNTCMRRGAYDAFNLPSLSFTGLSYRKEAIV
jgi:hypothetical protein